MATATSSRPWLAIVAALALSSAAALAACGSDAPAPDSNAQAFGWLRPSPPPHRWQESRLPDGSASLAYPAGWRAIRSDPGTVTAALRARDGEIRGYLNATPQQGEETLATWSSFRVEHNRDEGDVNVEPVASATNLGFLSGHGSCVIDTYTSSTGHPYREIACIIAGQSATTVIVGAAPPDQWQQQAPAIERALSSFLT
jgi:hypothetical protein